MLAVGTGSFGNVPLWEGGGVPLPTARFWSRWGVAEAVGSSSGRQWQGTWLFVGEPLPGPFQVGCSQVRWGKDKPPSEGCQGMEGPGHFVWSVGVSARRCWESPGSGWGLRFKRRRGHGRTGTSLLSLQGALSQLWPGKGPQRGWGSLLGHLQLLPAAQQGEGPHQPAKWGTMLQTL